MIQTLISSKTRVKLLIKFFLNSDTKSYLRNLETEFGESTNAIRLELNKFEKAGMLLSEQEGNRKYFKANIKHPLFKDINNIVFKYVGLDWIIDHIAGKLGNLQKVYLTGSFANGLDSDSIELVFVGTIDEMFLNELCNKVKKKINKEISCRIIDEGDLILLMKEETGSKYLLLWENEK
jgi:predicted transcriptional regulator